MEDAKRNPFWYIVVAIILILILWNLFKPKANHSELAKCLKDKGIKFYGASWCHFCKDQKALFGSSASELPYVECMAPDNSENKVCTDLGIHSFPTWILPDGTKREGLLPIEELKKISGC